MKRRGRILSANMLLLLVMAVALSACGGNNGAAPTASAPTETTNGSAATEPAGTDETADKPTVAFVYIGPPGDGGYTYQHDQGRLYMEEQLGIKADYVENIPETADAERIITELAQNHDVVFTTSFGYMDFTLNVANKFPNVKFMHASGYKTSENMGTYFGKN